MSIDDILCRTREGDHLTCSLINVAPSLLNRISICFLDPRDCNNIWHIEELPGGFQRNYSLRYHLKVRSIFPISDAAGCRSVAKHACDCKFNLERIEVIVT